MTQNEFHQLNNIEIRDLPEEEFLKHLIKFCEERYIWYKKQIEFVYKKSEKIPADDELSIWFKDHLREMKNFEQSRLKELRIEIEYLRQNLNPPFCYKY